MKCPRCQAENPLQAKFCIECAAPLTRTCGNCGTSLPTTAKFSTMVSRDGHGLLADASGGGTEGAGLK